MAQNFLKVECDECGNQQKVYSRPATKVECMVCSEPIAKPTGGKAELNGKVVKHLEVE